MKKLSALILVLVMAISYTVFAEEDYYEEEYYEDTSSDFTEEEYNEDTSSDFTEEEYYEEYEGTYDGEVYEQTIPIFDNVKDDSIKVYVDGRRILFDTDPMLVNSRTMVPVRAIFESLGATVTWDNDTQTAIGVIGDTTVKITIGQSYLTKNDEVKELDSPAFLTSGRTYVPARAIAESFDCTVDWNNDTKTVTIKSK